MEIPVKGHRKRLQERYVKSGVKGLHDYEIIELVLTFALPRKDTKPIAKTLIKRFGSVNSILNAEPEELERIKGVGSKCSLLLSLFRDVISYCLCEKYKKQPLVSNRKDVEEYLRFHFGMRKHEFFAILLLDNGNHVIATESDIRGTINQCIVYPRTVIEMALKYGASSIIVAHNHPGGNKKASESDWQITKRLYTACKLFDISLLDHIIVLRDQVVSLREQSRWPG